MEKSLFPPPGVLPWVAARCAVPVLVWCGKALVAQVWCVAFRHWQLVACEMACIFECLIALDLPMPT